MALLSRSNLQALAKVRLDEARTLLAARKWDGAYYLAGYAVECGLKACIAAQTKKYDFPDRDLVNQSYTHNLEQLVRVAGLQGALAQERTASGRFASNWSTVRRWDESSRYRTLGEQAARDMVSAVGSPRAGVMTWIRRSW